MSRVFISYRRADSADITGRMYDHLVKQFGRDDVFKDVDSIDVGADFMQAVSQALESCDVILAVIGTEWVDTRNARGEDRLSDPNDFVRRELEVGLEQNIPIIPVLVRGADMPSGKFLPDSLKALSFRNAVPLRQDPDFASDIQRLNRAIARVLEETATRRKQKRLETIRRTSRYKISVKQGIYTLAGLLCVLFLYTFYSVVLRSTSTPENRTQRFCEGSNPPVSCLFRNEG